MWGTVHRHRSFASTCAWFPIHPFPRRILDANQAWHRRTMRRTTEPTPVPSTTCRPRVPRSDGATSNGRPWFVDACGCRCAFASLRASAPWCYARVVEANVAQCTNTDPTRATSCVCTSHVLAKHLTSARLLRRTTIHTSSHVVGCDTSPCALGGTSAAASRRAGCVRRAHELRMRPRTCLRTACEAPTHRAWPKCELGCARIHVQSLWRKASCTGRRRKAQWTRRWKPSMADGRMDTEQTTVCRSCGMRWWTSCAGRTESWTWT
mmetsp:Transcript_8010/g.49482  ORF Transcript_8010/g.49482 Transcript_8010/m.49482 type:complete len:265 (+) Transcript_8010:210-1004(+)